MNIFSIPVGLQAILFDMDSTLYTSEPFARAQIASQIERLAQREGTDTTEMEARLEDFRGRWAQEHGGGTLSLGNTLTHFGVSLEESIAWRTELIRASDWLTEDPKLQATLEALSRRFKLAVVTNNPVAVARDTLGVLGVEACFSAIFGLDTLMLSKPHRDIFLNAARSLGVRPGECLSVGDRYEIDLALPLELGMGAILVDGAEDVYKLVDDSILA